MASSPDSSSRQPAKLFEQLVDYAVLQQGIGAYRTGNQELLKVLIPRDARTGRLNPHQVHRLLHRLRDETAIWRVLRVAARLN